MSRGGTRSGGGGGMRSGGGRTGSGGASRGSSSRPSSGTVPRGSHRSAPSGPGMFSGKRPGPHPGSRPAGNRNVSRGPSGTRSVSRRPAPRRSSAGGSAFRLLSWWLLLKNTFRNDRPQERRTRETDQPLPATGDRQGFWMWVTLVATLLIVTALLAVSCSKESASAVHVASSTTRRTKLAAGNVVETGYYTDNLNWLGKNNRTVLKGMKYFYRQTGVQPYLYLTDTVDSNGRPTEEELAAYANLMYDTLFQDEGHCLLLVYENDIYLPDNYMCYCVAGVAASTVMDEEAIGILTDYLDASYFNYQTYPKGSEAKMVADIYRSTAKNIMAIKDRTAWIVALSLLLAVILAIVLIDFWKAWKKQKNLEAEQMKEILNTPLETFGKLEEDQKLGDLTQKYETFAGKEAENLAAKYQKGSGS